MGIQYFETDSLGYLPAGTDISAVLADGDVRALIAVWHTYSSIKLYRSGLAKIDQGESRGDDPEGTRAVLESGLAKIAEVTPVQALEANRRLVDLLTGYRWFVMRDAREAGDSWTSIGEALDMSKQGALDWYKRKIAFQEEFVPDFHDTDRARAVLGEG
ncbi:hypothetical protein [Nocardia africana]|uniref:Uncharacterized protein n=1 Tax=Nocardia africana TaxID=134964 RepID=A0A379X4P0_9NOCA|nr:hypothetical protein [Nocardia africana]MCC3318450.1 hypothetical protein [Nocardia africana]SUH71934.1 Uncharacterised protein [Nocardia africana]